MSRAVWDTLLDEARNLHEGHAEMREFCAFPDDVTPTPVTPHRTPAAELFASERALSGSPHEAFYTALMAAERLAAWQALSSDTGLDQDFLDRFGFLCLIGDHGAYESQTMRAWLLYLPAHLQYTWHHHVAEEAYLVVAGAARFFRHGAPDLTLKAGGYAQHKSNQPHAMETRDSPVLCYITWRNGLEHLPVLSQPEDFR